MKVDDIKCLSELVLFLPLDITCRVKFCITSSTDGGREGKRGEGEEEKVGRREQGKRIEGRAKKRMKESIEQRE